MRNRDDDRRDRRADHRTTSERGALFWFSAVAGWALIGWGLRGALHHHVDTRPASLARFFLGGALIHDLLLAPAVLAGGVALARVVPGRVRAPVQAALIISGTVALFAYPEIRGFAHALHNPTSLPHNYTVNTAIVVGVVWAGALVVAIARRGIRRIRRG